MILGNLDAQNDASGVSTTLDELFRCTLARHPDATALADPSNRDAFTDGAPRRLTYAGADRVVSAIARRLRQLGLSTDAVVGLQLANTVESVLTLLGVLRAGFIAAPMPLLWRHADAVAALAPLGVKCLITQARVGGVDHIDVAMRVAAEIFSIRHVCAFGSNLPDGVIPLDNVFGNDIPDPVPDFHRDGDPARHVAVVTFEITADGIVAMARNHLQLIAGGLAVMLEGGLAADAAILSPCNIGSFSGLATTLMPWLLTGGALSLHHPFDPATFAAECRDRRCDTVIVPGPLLPWFAEAGLLEHPDLRNVLALWHAPERLASSPAWPPGGAALIDVQAFGEACIVSARRNEDGRPADIAAGLQMTPRGMSGAVLVGELRRTDAGTLAVGGPMAPRHAFPPGAERTALAFVKADADGLVDTGQPCRIDDETQALVVTGPPPGMVGVGSYRFMRDELQHGAERAAPDAALAILPDAIAGHRLAGHAEDRAAMQRSLEARGINPLIVDAFRIRQRPDAV